jgi:succinoglycan biosynthesis protein ExoM
VTSDQDHEAIETSLIASVVICTYNRPALFEAALLSCLQNATVHGLPFEVIVADNSVAGHARVIVDRLRPVDTEVRVVTVSPPNISLARNAGIKAATAPFVAFMDDDLELEAGWLDALVGVLTSSAADVAVGPVRPDFAAAGPPDWDPTGARFTRVLPVNTGSLIAVSGPLKPADFALSTASSLWRAATCFTDDDPFDINFGACGGEDFDLFLRLERRGCRFVWCAEAGVRETVPPGRRGLRYQRLRAYSGAQVFSAALVKNSTSRLATTLNIVLRGLTQAMTYSPAAIVLSLGGSLGSPRMRRQGTRMAFKAAGGWGKLTWWRRVRLYHAEKPSA